MTDKTTAAIEPELPPKSRVLRDHLSYNTTIIEAEVDAYARAGIATHVAKAPAAGVASEPYEEVKATLTGLHSFVESLCSPEIYRRLGPAASHARGYTHKITAALRHLDRLASLASTPVGEPAGWKLVPPELTDEMVIAACEAGFWRVTEYSVKDVRAAYAAMLATSPAPAVAEPALAASARATQAVEPVAWRRRFLNPTGPWSYSGVFTHPNPELGPQETQALAVIAPTTAQEAEPRTIHCGNPTSPDAFKPRRATAQEAEPARKPLTVLQYNSIPELCAIAPSSYESIVRAIERAHGITAAQEGGEARDCSTCKHSGQPLSDAPCRGCGGLSGNGNHNKWEGGEAKGVE